MIYTMIENNIQVKEEKKKEIKAKKYAYEKK
jgi:hypothetical protein